MDVRAWRIVQGKRPQPTKVSPDTLYHGTSSRHLASIKRHGLIPAGRAAMGATGSRSWAMSGGSTYDMVGLVGVTDRSRSAAFYASMALPKYRPVIIVIDRKRLNERLLVRRRGSHIGGGKEWDYPKRIPLSAIRGYWVYMKYHKKKQYVYKTRR